MACRRALGLVPRLLPSTNFLRPSLSLGSHSAQTSALHSLAHPAPFSAPTPAVRSLLAGPTQRLRRAFSASAGDEEGGLADVLKKVEKGEMRVEDVEETPLVLDDSAGRIDLNNPDDVAHFQDQMRRGSKRQQKFLMEAAIKNAQIAHPTLEEEMWDRGVNMEGFKMVVINVNRTCKSTKAGGLFRYSALVVAGNGKGLVGYALAKGPEPAPATEKAFRYACKNLHFINRFDDHTIWHETTAKHCKTKVVLLPAETGTGLVCNSIVRQVCTLAGIKNLRAKVVGSHHPHNTIHAVFKALNQVYTPQELSDLRGRHVDVY